jgi:two-component system response regulator ChvI
MMHDVAGATRVMLVDDDALFLGLLADNLRTVGYEVWSFDTPRHALAQIGRGARPDVCVLDWDMPEINGLALLTALRRCGVHAPVLFLTAHGGPMFEETALDAGAADFVDKSRGPAIIRQRIALALARGATPAGPAAESETLRVGELVLAREAKRAHWRGVPVPLSRNEFDLVALLVEKAGQDVGYRQLYDTMHGPGFVAGQGETGYRANVRAMVKRIRRKFLELDPAFEALQNYAGFGYRWRQDD